MKKIVLTGGGTAGHVNPHFALIPHLQKSGWEIHYIEPTMELSGADRAPSALQPNQCRQTRAILRCPESERPFPSTEGIAEAYRVLRRIRPRVVFSKGGLFRCSVTVAAWLLRIPVILHESDLTPGLANKLSLPLPVNCA